MALDFDIWVLGLFRVSDLGFSVLYTLYIAQKCIEELLFVLD